MKAWKSLKYNNFLLTQICRIYDFFLLGNIYMSYNFLMFANRCYYILDNGFEV